MISDRERRLLAPGDQPYAQLYARGQHARLLGALQEPLKQRAATPGMLGLAALACSALGRHGEAARLAEAALGAQPRWAWLHGALAVARLGLGDLAGALAEQRVAARLAPGEPGHLAQLAHVERTAGDPAAAARTARQALVLQGGHAGALNELGLALLAQGDAPGALARFRQAQAAAPADPQAFFNEGLLHREQGAGAPARAALRAALRRDPDLDAAEDLLVQMLPGGRTWPGWLLGLLLATGRLGLVGMSIAGFIYYVAYRLLQIGWRLAPGLEPVARTLLLAAGACLVGAVLAGRLLRLAIRLG